jgi:glycosyltransferase involved in cell wall biosynthesis
VSPLHAKVINEFVGLSSDRTLVLDPVLDPRPFLDAPDSTREIALLFAGPFNEAKGSAEIKRRWPNGEVRIVGPMTKDARSYRGYAGATPYSDMPALLKRTHTFVFHPRWPEPFGRVVSEAVLSGCKLDANERVGALSFGVDLSDPLFYKDAAAKFWLTIESLRT